MAAEEHATAADAFVASEPVIDQVLLPTAVVMYLRLILKGIFLDRIIIVSYPFATVGEVVPCTLAFERLGGDEPSDRLIARRRQHALEMGVHDS
jgi:hypothetical protein